MFTPHQRRPNVLRHSVLAGCLAFLVVTPPFAAREFTFSSPPDGARYRVGDVLRIEFAPVDTGIHTTRDILRFSNDKGFSWKTLAMLNGLDSVSITRHLDWVIPADIGGAPVTGDTCLICLFLYEPRIERGLSGAFSISDGAGAIRTKANRIGHRMNLAGPVLHLTVDRSGPSRPLLRTSGVTAFRLDGRSGPAAVTGRTPDSAAGPFILITRNPENSFDLKGNEP